MSTKIEYQYAPLYFDNTLLDFRYNKVKAEDDDNDEIMLRQEPQQGYQFVDPFFTRSPAPQQQYYVIFQRMQQQFANINTPFNNFALCNFMQLAMNRIHQRMQAHVCPKVSNIVLGLLPLEQWHLLLQLAPLEATQMSKTQTRCVNGELVQMPTQSIRFYVNANAPFWSNQCWGKRYNDCSNGLHRLLHCELNYVTLKYAHYDNRVTMSFSYTVWKFMQNNEVAHVPSHWVVLAKTSK